MAVPYKFPRGTKAALDAKASGATLIPYAGYWLTDTNRLAIATSTTGSITLPNLSEVALLSGANFTGAVRVTGASSLTGGAAFEMFWNGTTAALGGYNRDTLTYLPVSITGASIKFNIAGPDKVTIDSEGIILDGRLAATGLVSGSNLSNTNTGDETKGTIDTKIGATGGTEFYRKDGTWAVPAGGAGGISDGDKGDITVSASGTTWTVDLNAIGNSKIGLRIGNSIMGRSGAASGNVTDIIAGNDGEVLRRAGGALAFGSIETAGIGNSQVTLAKIVNASGPNKILGRYSIGAGVYQELTVSSGLALDGSGNLTAPVFSNTVAGIVPASGGGTVNFLRADGTWSAPSVSATNVSVNGLAWNNIPISTVSVQEALDYIDFNFGPEPIFTSATIGVVPASGGGTTKFLRADGTWVAPASGNSWTVIKLAADYLAPNTATFANVTDGTTTLSFTPPANSDWEATGKLLVETATAANLPRVGVSITAGATSGYGAVNIWQAPATAQGAGVGAFAGWKNPGAAVVAQIAAGGFPLPNVPYEVEISMSGRSGASPQPIIIQLANETAAANMGKVLRGSFIRWSLV